MSDPSIPHTGELVVDVEVSSVRSWKLTFTTHAQNKIRKLKCAMLRWLSTIVKPMIPTHGKNDENIVVNNYSNFPSRKGKLLCCQQGKKLRLVVDNSSHILRLLVVDYNFLLSDNKQPSTTNCLVC